MSASTQQRYGLPLVARVSIVAAFLEAFTWAGLLAGMFLIYLAIALITAITLRWPWRVTALSIIAAVPPLTTIPLEIWLRRRGHLSC